MKDKHDRPDAGSDVGGIHETGLSQQIVGRASHDMLAISCVSGVQQCDVVW